MESVTFRTSTIVVATQKRTKVYRSLEDVPRPVQKRLMEITSGPNARTLIIANRKGHERLLKALKGLGRSQQCPARPRSQQGKPISFAPARYYWLETLLIGLLGVVCWSLFSWK